MHVRNAIFVGMILSLSGCGDSYPDLQPTQDAAPSQDMDSFVQPPDMRTDCLTPMNLGTKIERNTKICKGTYVFTSTPFKHGSVEFEQEIPSVFSITKNDVTLTCEPGTIIKLVYPKHVDLKDIDFSAEWTIPKMLTWEEKVKCGNPADQWAGKGINSCLSERTKWQNRKMVTDYSHVGVYGKGLKNVTVTGCRFEGFKYGIYFTESSNLKIIDNKFRDNYNLNEEIFLKEIDPKSTSWNGWLPFYPSPGWVIILGGDLFLGHVKDSLITKNEGIYSANGADCYFCNNVTIKDNKFPSHAQTNVHLLNSNYNIIENNDTSFGTRTSEGGCSDSGCDSAGLLLEEDSDYNTIKGNDITFGGDGFFIRAVHHRCPDYNLVENNDASFSPHNAFENVFCVGNRFINNKASYSHHGFWIGYSKGTLLKGNTIESNYFGISAEHVVQTTIVGNTISKNRDYGIKLWTDDDLSGLGKQDVQGFLITNNTITTGDQLYFDGVLDGIFFSVINNKPNVHVQKNYMSSVNFDIDYQSQGKPYQELLPFAALGPVAQKPEIPSILPQGVRYYHRPITINEPYIVIFKRPASLTSIVQAVFYPGDGRKIVLKPGDSGIEITNDTIGIEVTYTKTQRNELFLVVESDTSFYTGYVELLAAPKDELFSASSANTMQIASSTPSKIKGVYVSSGIQDPVVGNDYFQLDANRVDSYITLTLPIDVDHPATGIAYWYMISHDQVVLSRYYADMDAYNACKQDPVCLDKLPIFIGLPLIEFLDEKDKVLIEIKLKDEQFTYNAEFRWDYIEIPFAGGKEFIVKQAANFDPSLIRKIRWSIYQEYGLYSFNFDGVRLIN